MRARLALLCVVGTLAACRVGSRPETFRPAQGPRGADVRFNAAMLAELLTVSDTAFLVRNTRGQILLVPFRSIREADFIQLGGLYDFVSSRGPGASRLERIRLVARFPQGLTAEQLGQLLAAAGQQAPEVFR